MKAYKYISGGLIAIIASVSFYSCSESFLDEEYKSGYLSDYLKTEQGIVELAGSLYSNGRWLFAFEWAYGITSYGTDEFEMGTDATSEPWMIYDARLGAITTGMNANVPTPQALWDQLYYGISSANTVIANADAVTNADIRSLVLGEGHFMRGYNYYRLVSQYGGVVLRTEPSEGVVRTFSRASEEECLAQIIDDLQAAYELLPAQSDISRRGKLGWTKYTAAHFLAKALLLRVSERNESWNDQYKNADLARIITLCDDVIAHRPLAADYAALFAAWTGVNCEAETLPEILMAAEFDNGSTQGRYGNRNFFYWNCQFHNGAFGTWIQRGPWVGHNYQRCRPTEYNILSYDKVNDSRFWKSTRTIYNANKTAGIKNNNTGENYTIEIGDPVIIFIPNGTVSDDGSTLSYRWDPDWSGKHFALVGESDFEFEGKVVPNAVVHYNGNAGGQWRVQNNSKDAVVAVPKNGYVSLSKFEDGTRTSEGGNSYRDGVLARVAETYLIKAEALVRQGKYQEALEPINTVRRRAEYKANEDRSRHQDGQEAFETTSMFTQGSNATMYKAYSKKNTYTLATGLSDFSQSTSLTVSNAGKLPKEDEYILRQLNCSGDYDRMLNFIMNERTRELNGEFHRWEDLARTKLLVRRTLLFNRETKASNTLKDYHLYRPVPQSFIDGLINEDGTALTDAQKTELQNPGY
ncbi:MAG: RagB/SusD family nutrient uptake outer membrane protein [Tannerellaceae bacterium]|jgi:hypothetical protein|nr:RagB/SusD family nutrient uptake outer membrane protein [Tannerellaceae bacterium]